MHSALTFYFKKFRVLRLHCKVLKCGEVVKELFPDLSKVLSLSTFLCTLYYIQTPPKTCLLKGGAFGIT